MTAIAWALLTFLVPLAFAQAQFSQVARMGTNCEWASAGAIFGALQALSAYFGCAKPRWIMSNLMFFFWLALTDGIARAPILSPGAVLYAGWAAVNAISIFWVLRRRR